MRAWRLSLVTFLPNLLCQALMVNGSANVPTTSFEKRQTWNDRRLNGRDAVPDFVLPTNIAPREALVFWGTIEDFFDRLNTVDWSTYETLTLPPIPAGTPQQRIICQAGLPDDSYFPAPYNETLVRSDIALHDTIGLCAARHHGGNLAANMGGYCDQEGGKQPQVKFDQRWARPELFNHRDPRSLFLNPLKLWCVAKCQCLNEDLSWQNQKRRKNHVVRVNEEIVVFKGPGNDVNIGRGHPIISHEIVVTGHESSSSGDSSQQYANSTTSISIPSKLLWDVVDQKRIQDTQQFNSTQSHDSRPASSPPSGLSSSVDDVGRFGCPGICTTNHDCASISGADNNTAFSPCAVCDISMADFSAPVTGADPVFPPGRCIPLVRSTISSIMHSMVPRDSPPGPNKTSSKNRIVSQSRAAEVVHPWPIQLCRCNTTYASHRCCSAADGIIHEPASAQMSWAGAKEAAESAAAAIAKVLSN